MGDVKLNITALYPRLPQNLGVVVGPSQNTLPRGLALHSGLRLLFFVNMVLPSALLEVCRLDGSRRRVLVKKDLVEPVALTVDNGMQGGAPRLYWFDVSPARIESVTLSGGDR